MCGFIHGFVYFELFKIDLSFILNTCILFHLLQILRQNAQIEYFSYDFRVLFLTCDEKMTCTPKPEVLSVYCLHVIFLIFFFHNADVCIFAKTTALFNHKPVFIQNKAIVFTVSIKFATNRS